MEEFLEQIEESCKIGHFYLALFCCLALPDICGAISSDNGIADGERYKKWFDDYVAPNYGGSFTGPDCYQFRCAALHQGRSDRKGRKKIVFLLPTGTDQIYMHNNVMDDALNLDVTEFCHDVLRAVRTWIKREQTNPAFQRNMATFLRRYRGGLKPYIVGSDVLA